MSRPAPLIRSNPSRTLNAGPITKTNGLIEIDTNQLNKENAEEVAWTVIECLAEAGGMADAAKACMGMYKLIRGANSGLEAFEKDVDKGLVPNPEFLKLIDMGFTFSGHSTKTETYLENRLNKQIGAALFSWGGAAASAVTTVDVGTASLGAQSLALTGAHAVFLRELRVKYPNEEFRGYLDMCLAAKLVKATSRGISTTMAVIPYASLPAKIATAVVNTVLVSGAKLTLHKAIDRTAQMLHFHAYLEQSDAGDRPATEVMNEIFRRRGVLGFFSQYDVKAIINEPAGWLALADKLKLI
ncbi:MAG: hypothetical protein PSU93_10540 [Methylobacter sp.]|uniref:Uncharacterized protein n=1 Tax=Candidatus Methylobacter titanis TaxID=3053457 RepID=A0AA43TLV9_9GAMM|nr:hypothetical protein [Candidatus Methylobacter titanis]